VKAKERGYKVLVYPARLHPIKNHSIIIKILWFLIKKCGPRILLVLIGEGVSKQSIIKLAKKLGVSKNILMTGKLPYDETLRILNLADAVPYVSLYEAHPLTLIEALYLGKSIIAFNYPYVIEVKDVCASKAYSCSLKLVDSIRKFIEELLYELSFDVKLTSRKIFIGQFSLDRMISMYLNLYREALMSMKL
ncbi:MAG: glycosyltransferase, partial [Desulfurococcaceae archaeon]